MYHLFNLLYHITCGNIVYLSILFFDDKDINLSKSIIGISVNMPNFCPILT